MAMSEIYQKEVPLYADLLRLVASVNNAVLQEQPGLRAQLLASGEMERLHYERHGAIRLGTADEMAQMARFLGLMGMQAVGYYDLSQPPACLPIHATCFRCLDRASLSANPFRMFVSLLRPELLSSERLRQQATQILARRSIFSPRALAMISDAEARGGRVLAAEADEFVREGLWTFQWSGQATVSLADYHELQAEDALLADIVCFPGPHINHLTPRTLDIDAVQKGMDVGDGGTALQQIPMKDMVEGPPRRDCAILLRQTSFKALEESVYFPVGDTDGQRILGSHTARFGEIEQRGAALTEKGRALYDELMSAALAQGITARDEEAYRKAFAPFPDTWDALREQDLAFFRYYPVEGRAAEASERSTEELIQAGKIAFEPLTYEDFLPLSAAGIFQSNLGKSSTSGTASAEAKGDDVSRKALEEAIGKAVLNEFHTYRQQQEESLEQCRKHFGGSQRS